jgi:tyrosine-specific transport protein
MSLKNAIGGIAFIAGTAVGAAVLALPVATAHLGFWQSTSYYFIVWVFMTLGALFLLEVNLCVGYGSNLISMAKSTLGNFGAYITWIIYLALFYALTAAYLTGAGAWVKYGVPSLSHPMSGPIIAAALTCLIIMLGTKITDWCNRLIMIGLISSFIIIILKTSPHINPELLFPQAYDIDISPLPLIITAFGFAIIVPTLAEYLHGNAYELCKIILIGSALPIIMYLIWEGVTLGIIPLDGENGLLKMQMVDQPEIDLPKALSSQLNSNLITKSASVFSIFALISSILGVTLSLFDFLSDGLKIKKSISGKTFLSLITFIPPLIFLYLVPSGFSQVLSFAGIFVALLLGILPAIMAWRARYTLKMERKSPMFGGKIIIILSIIFFSGIIISEIYHQLWL